MKLQLGNKQSSTIDAQIIQESHIPDQSVEPFDKDTYYASGWAIFLVKTTSYFEQILIKIRVFYIHNIVW